MSEGSRMAELSDGAAMFDYNEQKRGHAAMCASVLADFPNVLRK